MNKSKDFILASGSADRKKLLEVSGLVPAKIDVADIDESEKKGETPPCYVKRIAIEKAKKVYSRNQGRVVLAADTIVAVGRRMLHKANSDEEQTKVMKLLSGRTHRVITAVCLINSEGKISTRVVSTRIIVKKMSDKEISEYVATKEWVGACGYRIDGVMDCYMKKIIGSYSGIIGLPMYETRNLLIGAGVL